ncbi:MAG: DinB family protein [Saprospiraceae bacterium]|nr:DinB family protein [Saprospiraceae bacterium]
MNIAYFQELSAYNVWANQLVCGWLKQLTAGQWTQPIISSFGSIADTTIHIAGAEKIWLDRLNQVENPIWLPAVFKGSQAEALSLWQQASVELTAFVRHMEDHKLNTAMSFRRINGDVNELSHYQVLAHVFNHTTHHRGQLITMLRQLGFTAVSSTDVLRFYNERKQP